MIETITQALLHTPWWVYVLFIYLMFVGIKSLKTRVVPLTRLIILPVFFTWMAIDSLLSALQVTPFNIGLWMLFVFLGTLIGWILIIRLPIRVDKNKWLLEIPGSASVLILILIIFASKYYFAYHIATDPQRTQQTSFVVSMIAVYGIVMGLFVGRFLCYLYLMLVKPSEKLD